MKMDVVAGSQNDEFYTPDYAIQPLLKYLKKNAVIWCPFDTTESRFTQVLTKEGHSVYFSHLNYGEDFFNFIPECGLEKIDYIISNPPYSLKGKVLQRLFSLGKPFAMLVGVVGLFESQERFQMFKDNDFEVLYLNRRISYFKDYSEQKPSLNPPFSSVYICKGILPKQIVFETVNKNTTEVRHSSQD